jgi:hypothetical protein
MSSPKPTIAIRPPPRPVDVESFVAGGQPLAVSSQALASSGQALTSQPPAANHPTVRPPTVSHATRRRKGIVQRASGVERARLTVYLDPSDAVKLRRYCFEQGLEISDVAADAIGRLLSTI